MGCACVCLCFIMNKCNYSDWLMYLMARPPSSLCAPPLICINRFRLTTLNDVHVLHINNSQLKDNRRLSHSTILFLLIRLNFFFEFQFLKIVFLFTTGKYFFFSYSFFFLIELKILETDWKQIAKKKKKMDYSYYLKIESEIKVIGREIFDEISSPSAA